ncbi:MAG: AI-2E family transporter [Spirochaetales bacterium]|nr:AI-2E family transporter [Spirochaetales bacterium]
MTSNRTSSILLAVLTFIAVVAVIKLLKTVLMPFMIALLLSFILSPIIAFLHRIKIPRGLAIAIVLLIFFGALYLLGLFVYAGVNSFVDEFPKYQHRFIEITKILSGWISERIETPIDLFGYVDWAGMSRNLVRSFSGDFMQFVSSLVVIIFFLIFILLEKPYFRIKLEKAFIHDTNTRIGRIMGHTNKQIGRYLGVKLFISVVTGFLVGLSLSIIGMDFAVIWGFLAIVLNFIPNIGSLFVMLVTILMGFIQFFPSAGRIAAVIASMILIQLVMGNFLDPRMQGHRLNLSPLLLIFSLILWGWLWGVVGMFLAVPIMAVIKIIFENIPILQPIAIMMENGKKHPSLR